MPLAIWRLLRPRPSSVLASAIVCATAGPALAPLAAVPDTSGSPAEPSTRPPRGWLEMLTDPLGDLRGRIRWPALGQDEDVGGGEERQANIAEPETLSFGPINLPRPLVETLIRAARVTGVDPVYLMALADKESSFRTEVRASTSSAEGLFQFIERTWLEMVRDFGGVHGLAAEARLIRTVDERPVVEDAAERRRILDLRRDPYLAAVMAAELMKRDGRRIERVVTRPLAPTDRYLAHFLGPDDAERFLWSHARKPKLNATRLFPAAARANQALFTVRNGRTVTHLTVAQLYDRIATRIDHRVARYNPIQELAANVPWPTEVGLARR